MANLPWTCSCGRKVPWSITVCRCGKPRPEPGPTLAGAAEALSKLPQAEAGPDWSWVPKLLGVLALVGLYFGSRMLNRYNASKEVRTAAVQALGEALGETQASEAVARHHAGCFDKFYETGWGRRQSSRFDTEKYARCVLDQVQSELTRNRTAQGLAALEATRAERAARGRRVAAARPPSAAPVERPSWGQVTLGDVKLVSWSREPQLTVEATFLALGSQLTRDAFCSFRVSCDGQADQVPLVVSCPLSLDGVKGTGRLQYALAGSATADASCSLELQLSDGGTTRSNTVAIPLR